MGTTAPAIFKSKITTPPVQRPPSPVDSDGPLSDIDDIYRFSDDDLDNTGELVSSTPAVRLDNGKNNKEKFIKDDDIDAIVPPLKCFDENMKEVLCNTSKVGLEDFESVIPVLEIKSPLKHVEKKEDVQSSDPKQTEKKETVPIEHAVPP